MANGIFTIIPDGMNSITCSLGGEISGNNYKIPHTRIDFNEGERKRVAYANAQMGGSARKETYGLVPIVFDVLVCGSDMADAIANLSALSDAIMAEEGGWIKFRPSGHDSGVMSTYYRYLSSAPLKLIRHVASLSDYDLSYVHEDADIGHGILCRAQVMTKAWAQSDPWNWVVLQAETEIDNYYDDSHDNYVNVDSGNIKGSAFRPIIDIGPAASYGTRTGYVWMHHRRMYVGASAILENNDVIDSGDMDTFYPSWATQAATYVCGGSYTYISSDGYAAFLNNRLRDRFFYGAVPLYACARTTGEYSARYKIDKSGVHIVSTDDVSVTNSEWGLIRFDELQYPTTPVPEWIEEDEMEYASNQDSPVIDISRTSGRFDLDFLWMPNADEGLFYFEAGDQTNNFYLLDNSDYLRIDTVHSVATKTIDTDDTDPYYPPWKVSGGALNELILKKGYDHKLRFFCADKNGEFHHTRKYNVSIKGYHLTIYPFGVS